MKISLLTLSFLFAVLAASAQQIRSDSVYIGQDAEEIQSLAAREVQTHYNAHGYLMKLYAETRYDKGKISEVILIKENILIRYLQKSINVYIHYIMVDG